MVFFVAEDNNDIKPMLKKNDELEKTEMRLEDAKEMKNYFVAEAEMHT